MADEGVEEMSAEELAGKLEQLELGFEELLVQLSVEEMNVVCQGLELDENLWKERSKLQNRKVLRLAVEKEDEVARLKTLVATSKLMMNSIQGKKTTATEAEEIADETKVEQKKKITIEKDLLTQMAELLTASASGESGTMDHTKAAMSTLLGVSSALRKDFRITGHISADSTVKDRITYVNVLKQIEEGKQKKYTEKEILLGIQKAIPAQESSLRSYLEITPDLDLEKVLEFIRMMYHEKTPTELYQELVQLKQKKGEEASEFLVRAMEIRGKIVFVAKDANEIQYTASMVQAMFLRTIESGMVEEVLNMIRPVLVIPGVTDVKLMQTVTEAESMLKLRESKGTEEKKAVNSVEVVDYQKQLMDKVLKMMDEFEKMRKRLDRYENERQQQHQQQINNQQQQQQQQIHQPQQLQQPGIADPGRNQNRGNRNVRPYRRCESCTTSNAIECKHCWKCGNGDHKSYQCTGN